MARQSTTKLLVLQNDGNGGFGDINVLADDVQGFSRIAIGDFDGDGLDDIALNASRRIWSLSSSTMEEGRLRDK